MSWFKLPQHFKAWHHSNQNMWRKLTKAADFLSGFCRNCVKTSKGIVYVVESCLWGIFSVWHRKVFSVWQVTGTRSRRHLTVITWVNLLASRQHLMCITIYPLEPGFLTDGFIRFWDEPSYPLCLLWDGTNMKICKLFNTSSNVCNPRAPIKDYLYQGIRYPFFYTHSPGWYNITFTWNNQPDDRFENLYQITGGVINWSRWLSTSDLENEQKTFTTTVRAIVAIRPRVPACITMGTRPRVPACITMGTR